MHSDELINLAVRLVIAFWFLCAPFILARRWFPRTTRVAERLAVPLLGALVLLAVLAALVPYLLVLFIPLLCIGVPLWIYVTMQQRARQRRFAKSRPRRGRQVGRHQVVKRPPGRQRQPARRRR